MTVSVNPWTFADWNLTLQAQYVQQFGLDRAQARARDAGTTVGGPRPKPAGVAPVVKQTTVISRRSPTTTTATGPAVPGSGLGAISLLDYFLAGDADYNPAFARALAVGAPICIPWNGGGVYNFSAVIDLPSNTFVFSEGGLAKSKTTTVGRLFRMTGVSGVRIQNLWIDGNKAGGITAGPTFDFQGCSDCLLEDCVIDNPTREIRLGSGSTRITVQRNKITNSANHSIQVDGSGTQRNKIIDNVIDNGVGFGVILSNGANRNLIKGNSCFVNGIELIGITSECWGNRIIGNHAEGTGDNGISVTGYSNTVVGNECRGCYHAGIHLYGHGNTATGNVCVNNSQRFPVDGLSFDGITISPDFGGRGSGNVAAGNICYDDQAVPTQGWGVLVTGIQTHVWITGDTIATARTYRYFGTNCYINASTGVTGGSAPVHTSGTVSDGGVDWTFLFGLWPDAGATTLNASGNAVTGNVTFGNRLGPEFDNSGESNSVVGGNHSFIRSIKNLFPTGTLNGYGGDLVIRHGAQSAWIAAFVNYGSPTVTSRSWFGLQPRAYGGAVDRPTLGAGFEGAQFFHIEKNRLEIAPGVNFPNVWVDAMGRQDVQLAVAAAGTTQADATVLLFAHAEVTTVGAGQGCRLPPILYGGASMTVWNESGTALLLYPAVGAAIDALGTNNPITVPANSKVSLLAKDLTRWRS